MAGGMCREMVFRVPLKDIHYARSILDALAVDHELQPERVSKTLALELSTLVVKFVAEDWRMLRVAAVSFIEYLGVAVRCVNALPPPADLALTSDPHLNPHRPSERFSAAL
ncbi:transcription factor Pcc1-domain-containing protein [Pavlovales sp. CCMP2436]|nr:transcription factor Pcc1-domain-containing protein [Pavlovales sp. CCMP2436]